MTDKSILAERRTNSSPEAFHSQAKPEMENDHRDDHITGMKRRVSTGDRFLFNTDSHPLLQNDARLSLISPQVYPL